MKNWIILLFVLVSSNMIAQDIEDDGISYSEFGFNATPLILQILPFKSIDTRSGPFGFVYKHFNGDIGFKLALGGNIELDFNDSSYLNFSLGFEKKRDIGSRWSWYQAYDFILSGGSLNLPNETVLDDGVTLVALGFGIGGEYRITPHVAVGTETQFLIGFTEGGSFGFGRQVVLRTVPPIAIYLRFRKF